MGVLYQEKQDFSFFALLSDIGGALGLVLGMSLVDILISSRKEMIFDNQKATKISNFSDMEFPDSH
jgi:hypothetical protein